MLKSFVEQRKGMTYWEKHLQMFSGRKIQSFKCQLENKTVSGEKHILFNGVYTLICCGTCKCKC